MLAIPPSEADFSHNGQEANCLTVAERSALIWRARTARRLRRSRRGFLLGVLFAILLPALVRALLGPRFGDPSLENALIGTAAAVIAGDYFYRSFVRYPGVRSVSYVLPAFSASYSVVLAVFFFMRIEYSRAQFAASFALIICWYVAFMAQNLARRYSRIGIVPVGDAPSLCGIRGVEWRQLTLDGDQAVGCDSIVTDLRVETPKEWERLLAEYAVAGVPVLHYRQIQESLTGTVQIEHLSENSLGSLMPERLYLRIKFIIEYGATLVVLPILTLLFLFVALAIKLDSPGPVFFSQQRVGFRGRRFNVLKFRTMRVGATKADGRDAAMTRILDPRITRVGAVLRRYRIDELPQALNILRAEMSWIGPRPEAEVLSRWYESELPFYRYRHIVRPGVSGWAQVNQGHVIEMRDVLGKLHYDFYYIKYFSPSLDLLIALRTLRAVLTGFGSR